MALTKVWSDVWGGDRVGGEGQGQGSELPNADGVARVGGVPPYKLLDTGGVRRVKKAVPIPDGGEAANG